MSKTTKPRTDWGEIKFDYINGMPLNNMVEKYNIDKSQIVRKAKEKGWGGYKSFAKKYDELATAANNMIEDHLDEYPEVKRLREEMNNQLLPSQIEQCNKEVAMLALYKHTILAAQQKIATALDTSAGQINEILATHKDGLYASRISADGSISYEPTNTHLKNLAPFFAENNKALGVTTAPQVAIQNNINDNNVADGIPDNKIVININGE